jgi:hypothetical protein
MTRQVRWLLLALASGLITFVVVRRRQQITEAIPQPLLEQAERFVIPWTTLERRRTPDVAVDVSTEQPDEEVPEEEDEPDDSQRRKVSSGHRISFRGKRYGPLPEALIGEYVEVEERDGKIFILHNGTPMATYDLQS